MSIESLSKDKLDFIEKEIIDILQGEVKEIIDKTRQNMVVVEEKSDGDSATIADIKIGEIFEEKLPKLLSGSVVIQEESFNEEIFKTAFNNRYIWILDPIDGTKAFRDTLNFEWCVGVCLLDNLSPVLSLVYIPEKWLGSPYLLSANMFREKVFNFGKPFNFKVENKGDYKYVSHIHKDFERNEFETKIANMFKNNEIIRAHAGHSTLAQFCEVAVNRNKIFSRRSANIWDIVQSSYLIEKSGGAVYYENGESIFPLKKELLTYENKHLLMPFTIASAKELKDMIINKI
ncbi:MAG: hypothetical protein IJX17_00845 [Clostridia bacterium]|nr:hypothetical protein [Clostridia bacterium]